LTESREDTTIHGGWLHEMDIIIDTNILRQDHLLRSAKSQAVLDYLKKTNSYLVIPTVVKEEMIGIFRRTLVELSNQLNKNVERIDSWCYGDTARTEINLDIEKEMSTYKTFMEGFTHGGGGLELPYDGKFMSEVIKRLVGRLKPASDKGEEFRDVVVWLSIKEFLKDTKKEAVFISKDVNHFADKDSKGLHPDLVAELAKDNLKLKYYSSVDDFIRQHSSKLEFVNSRWLKQLLLQGDIENMAAKYIEQHPSRYWNTSAALEGYLYALVWQASFRLAGIVNFYVYEMGAGDLFLHASCRGNAFATLQMEATRDLIEVADEVILEVEGKVSNRKLEALEVVGRRFPKEHPDFAAFRRSLQSRREQTE
jgi:hypothetical protein